MKIVVAVLILLVGFTGFSQNSKPIKKQIQLSGVLVTGDSLKAVKGASIKVTKTDSIDYSFFFSVPTDDNGFFTLMARPGDVIGFKKDGFQESSYIIPDTLKLPKLSIVQIIKSLKDTIQQIEPSSYTPK